MSYKLFVVLLKAHGTPYFHVCFATGYGERRLKNRRLRTGQGITGVAAATRKTVVVNDVRRDARYIPAVDGILSEMAVPLVARGRVIGVIDFESTKVNAFGNRERSLLRPLGGRIALAVDNASMHERTAAWNPTLKSLVKISHEFSTVLNLRDLLERVAVLTRQLEFLNLMKLRRRQISWRLRF